ncbi:MAG: hypothetical protein C0425_11045, partial [Chlorobiaceae bacterium]|nr:hypothetical protein [Chlorobiaceae bacterium]
MVKRKKRNIITWLLSSPYGILRPNQFGISLAFESAAKNNHRDIMEWLLTRTAGIPLPNQESVCSAFSKAAENNHRGIMEWLLTQPEGLPLPNQSTINFIYINLCAQQPRTPETENILRIMDPLVPEQERINQGRAPRQIVRDQGMSGEIHGYSNTMVPGFCDSGRTSPSENQRLFDLVLNQIETRIQGFPRNDIDTILTRLSAIDRIYVGQPEQLNIAQQALAYGLDEAAHFHLQKVLTFLDTLSPHAFDLWFKGFMDESITAYINSQHKLSCAKGIQERILTGLRGVDPGLGQIFKHAEAPLL